jgi:ABC-2 type transport system permease protein
LLSRRPVLLGLAYILVWEDLLGNLISGTQKFSIEQYVITIADHIAPTGLLQAHVGLVLTIVMSAVFTIGGTLAAVDRLRSFSMAGETS